MTARGNYVSSQTDARGNTVTYTYGNNISKMTGQPTAVKNPNNVTASSTYNSQNGRITGTAISGTASLALRLQLRQAQHHDPQRVYSE